MLGCGPTAHGNPVALQTALALTSQPAGVVSLLLRRMRFSTTLIGKFAQREFDDF